MTLRKPMAHQRRALRFALSTPNPALFMEQRMGKSLVALRWAKTYSAERVLVLCAKTSIPSWVNEASLEGIDLVYLPGPNSTRMARMDKPGWYVLNYEALRLCPELVREMSWDVWILDESTTFRNPKAQITKLLKGSRSNAALCTILTGEPRPENLMDYVSQFFVLRGTFLGQTNYWTVRHRYFVPDWSGYNWVPKKGTRQAFAKEIAKHAFVLTRKQGKMPGSKVREYITLDPTPEQKAFDKLARKNFEYRDKAGHTVYTNTAPVVAGWLHRSSGGFTPDGQKLSRVKLYELHRLLNENFADQQVVVWCWFRKEIEAIQKLLPWTPDVLHGDVSLQDRDKTIKDFQSGRTRVLVAQVHLGRFSLDLSCADTAIYFSNSLAYEDRAQSEDRIIHPKKSTPGLVLDLVTRGMADEGIRQILLDKKTEAGSARAALIRQMELRARR